MFTLIYGDDLLDFPDLANQMFRDRRSQFKEGLGWNLFVDESGRSDYFTPEGRSVRKAFIRAPVDFTRISSAFNPNRRHPILNTIRAHRGVDERVDAVTDTLNVYGRPFFWVSAPPTIRAPPSM